MKQQSNDKTVLETERMKQYEEDAKANGGKGINLTLKQALERGIRPGAIIIPVVLFVTIIAFGIISPDKFVSTLWNIFNVTMINMSWMTALSVLAFVLFMIFFLVHPIGRVKLGGKDAKPEYSYWNWFAISLCAGVGTGIVFWGAIEPLRFTASPQLATGLEAGTRDAAIWAMAKAYMHWSFAPYATYGVFGVILAYSIYNLHQSYSISSGFAPLLGSKTTEKTWFRGIIDTICIIGITGGVAGSLGAGLLQITGGLKTVFGIPATPLCFIIVCTIIVIAYNTSSISGMDKGIKFLSDKNAWMFMIFLVLCFVFGPGQFICNLFTESVGSFLSTFVESITQVTPFTDAGTVAGSAWHKSSELWYQWWDNYYFCDFLGFGAIVGIFSVKLAKGRTLREYVIMNWLLPAIFAIIWFAILGGLTLDINYNYSAYADRVSLDGCATLFEYMETFGNEAMLFKVLEAIPLAFIWKPVALFMIVISFVTLGDSMTSTVALMTIKNNVGVNEAPASIKLMWGVIMGVTSLVFVLLGGLEGNKVVKTLTGFPIMFIGVAMMIMFLIYVVKHGRSKEVKDMMAD